MAVSAQALIPLPTPNKGWVAVVDDRLVPEGALVKLVDGVSEHGGVRPIPRPVLWRHVANTVWHCAQFAETTFVFNISDHFITVLVLSQRNENYLPTFKIVQYFSWNPPKPVTELTVLPFGKSLVLFFPDTSNLYTLSFEQGCFKLVEHKLPFIARYVTQLNEWRLVFGYIYESGRWYPTRVRWTNFNSFKVDELSFIDLPESGDIIGMTAYEGQIVVFRENGVDLLRPTGDITFPFQLIPSIRNYIFKRPIAHSIGSDGIYLVESNLRVIRTDGRKFEVLSELLPTTPKFAPIDLSKKACAVQLHLLRLVLFRAPAYANIVGFSPDNGTFFEKSNFAEENDWDNYISTSVVENKCYMVCDEVNVSCSSLQIKCSDAHFKIDTLFDFSTSFPLEDLPLDAVTVKLSDFWQVVAVGDKLFVFPAPDRLTEQMTVTYPFNDGNAPRVGKRFVWLEFNIEPMTKLVDECEINFTVKTKFFLPKEPTAHKEDAVKFSVGVNLFDKATVRRMVNAFGQSVQVEFQIPKDTPVRLLGGAISFVGWGNIW